MVPPAYQTSYPAYDQKEPTFYPFIRLPVELRYYIWRLAIPGARIINIKQNIGRSHEGVCEFCGKQNGCHIGRYGLPVDSKPISEPLLSVSQESRKVALDIYSVGPLITVSPASDLCPARQPGKFVYKPAIDVLYWQSEGGFLNPYPPSAILCIADRSTSRTVQIPNAQRIACNYKFYGYFYKQFQEVMVMRQQSLEPYLDKPLFPDVKEFAIIVYAEGFEVHTDPNDEMDDLRKFMSKLKVSNRVEMTPNMLDAWSRRVAVKGYVKETTFEV